MDLEENTGDAAEGMTSLIEACIKADLDLVKKLISEGTDINEASDDGLTPLHCACFTSRPIAELLIHCGADVNMTDPDGWTPLHYACNSGNSELVKQLIENGANVNRTDLSGQTPFNIACSYVNPDVAKITIERGGDIETTDNRGNTSLQEAVHLGSSELVECINEIAAGMGLSWLYD